MLYDILIEGDMFPPVPQAGVSVLSESDDISWQLFCVFQAGLIEEMMEDTFEGLEDDDLEEQADQEVEKILWEVTSGKRDIPKITLILYIIANSGSV